MFKINITKAEWEALSEVQRQLYVVDGDGYKLPLAENDDPSALRRARDRERDDAKQLRADLLTLKNQIAELEGKTARETGDVKALESSWQKKFTDRETELNGIIDGFKQAIGKSLVEQAMSTVSAAVTAKPEHAALLKPHIAGRFDVVFDGNAATLKIKDKEGKPSALSLDDLQKEILADPTFGTIVVASKASGSGAAGGNGGKGGGAAKKFGELSEAERVALFRENPTEFKRLAAEAKQQPVGA
jgi:hypothetical protein